MGFGVFCKHSALNGFCEICGQRFSNGKLDPGVLRLGSIVVEFEDKSDALFFSHSSELSQVCTEATIVDIADGMFMVNGSLYGNIREGDHILIGFNEVKVNGSVRGRLE